MIRIKSIRFTIGCLYLILFILLPTSYSQKNESLAIILVGSTPGDEVIKSMLSIPTETKVDFIRWKLELKDKSSFLLNLNFGVAQPNTLGFKGGGEKRTIEGVFDVSKREGKNLKEVINFQSNTSQSKFSLVKISESVFHLLTPKNQLMVGNGGWSYSLNRKDAVNAGDILISSKISEVKSTQVVYDGRTPCQEIAAQHPEMNVSQSCFKLKWRLILSRDSITYLPTTYVIRKVVDNRFRDVSGKWTVVKGMARNPDLIVYKIEPDNPDESISFLVADDNVLFFLDKNDRPFVGNENFSFTLNKKE